MDEANAKSLALVESIEDSDASIIVHLSKTPIDDTADSLLLSAITEADFVGYQAVEMELEPCAVDNDEYAEVASQEIIFEVGEVVTHQVVYYAYATSTPPGGIPNIIGLYEFPEPLLVDTPGMEITTGAWRFRQIPTEL
jgi:hypothetical protein